MSLPNLYNLNFREDRLDPAIKSRDVGKGWGLYLWVMIWPREGEEVRFLSEFTIAKDVSTD